MNESSVPAAPIEIEGETRQEKLRCITDKLEEGVKAVFTSDKFREYLKFLSKFHDYSFGNVLLIAMQKPDASLVAGFNDWSKKHHRHVRKGEKGIKILAPIIVKKKKKSDDGDGDKKTTDRKSADQTLKQDDDDPVLRAFKIVTVFDVSQTEGEPIPSYGVDELTGDVARYDSFMAALTSVSPVPIGFEDIPGSSHGYYHLVEKRIAIQSGMSQLQTIKTAIHETAHATLHALPKDGKPDKDGPDRRTKEVQAESVAYVVCQHYGLDTSDYSFAYVAGWSSGRDIKELKASLDVIRRTSHDMITSIDDAFARQTEAA